MTKRLSRRRFLRHAGGAAVATPLVGYFSASATLASDSPNEKLNVACIGIAHRGRANVNGVRGENIVALCDVDDNYLTKVGADFPKAERYHDFRKLLDRPDIDAITVSTADHQHASATLMAMRRGLHVYCEKPLTHSVSEARLVAKVAAEKKVATQMGTQIHSSDNYRRVVEVIQSGAIGPVRDVHVWVGKGWGGGDRPTGSDPVPANLKWDLWLGAAPSRPFVTDRYHPGQWRRWWDFGGGTLGDMACHLMDLPFWALGLSHPTTVRAEGPAVHAETCPLGLTVHYEFPARGDDPAVKLHWYDGDKLPHHLAEKELSVNKEGVKKLPGMGILFVGDSGKLFADYSKYQLLPEADFADYKPPEQSIAASVGHHQEWINACKTGSDTLCNFNYSGALTEAVLLGNVAFRTGKTLNWDAMNLKATNCPEADQFLSREYRPGWEL